MSQSSKTSRWAAAAGALAALGLAAYYVNQKAAQAEAHNPPRGRFIDVDGVRLHYTSHGDESSPVLVMLHGMGSMGRELEISGLVERAASQYRVLVFDRPGYGHSERPQGRAYTPQAQARLFLQALAELGVERPVVFAHSWATFVALAMAEQAPEAIKGLVLEGGYFTPSARLDVLFNAAPALPLIGPVLAHTVSPLLSRAIWGALTWRVFSPAPRAQRQSFSRRYPIWMSLRPGSLRAAAAENAMLIPASVRWLGHYADLEVPVVIVAGEQDKLVMARWHSRRVQDRLPNCRLHVVPGVGHMVHHTAPDAVFEAIREVSSLVKRETPADLSAPLRVAPEDEPLRAAL